MPAEENQVEEKPLIVISAPSGAGKTTITKRLLAQRPNSVIFSISATTREKREGERDGVDYFFLTREKFEELIAKKGLIEHEEVFGNFYGTPKDQVEQAINLGKRMLFDIDVKGGLSIKRLYPEESLLIFIDVPSREALRERLVNRGTDSPEVIERRLKRAAMEREMAKDYHHIVINDDLDTAVQQVRSLIFPNG